jgi:hypothetical protein
VRILNGWRDSGRFAGLNLAATMGFEMPVLGSHPQAL